MSKYLWGIHNSALGDDMNESGKISASDKDKPLTKRQLMNIINLDIVLNELDVQNVDCTGYDCDFVQVMEIDVEFLAKKYPNPIKREKMTMLASFHEAVHGDRSREENAQGQEVTGGHDKRLPADLNDNNQPGTKPYEMWEETQAAPYYYECNLLKRTEYLED